MTTTQRTLIQLAEEAQALTAAGAKPNQPVPLITVTPEEKKLLDNFVKGLSAEPGGCTHLHGCLIAVATQAVSED